MKTSDFDEVIQNILLIKDKEGNRLKMDGVMISDSNTTYERFFSDPNKTYDLRSISKVFTNLCLGYVMLKDNSIGLDSYVWPYFEKEVNITNSDNLVFLSHLKIKHLITHSMGFNDGLLFSSSVKEIGEDKLIEYVFNYPIMHEPGTHFVYSNAGPYIVSVIIQKVTGLSLSEIIGRYLFSKIGITDYKWKKYGQYNAAATGLSLKHKDLHKVARIIDNNGIYDGLQVIPFDWLQKMRSPQIATPSMYTPSRAFPKHDYGFGIWICGDGNYFCDGTDGQYIIFIPSKKIVISTTGHQPDMKPIGECFKILK